MTTAIDPRSLVPELMARDGWSRDELLAYQHERFVGSPGTELEFAL